MRKPIILCVDDEPINLRLLQAILTAEGYEVILAENGEEALRIIHSRGISLVLLDVMMPLLDGYEVCRRIKADEKLRHTPIIMLTALSLTEERIKGIEAGAEDFISKPFDRSEVLARIAMLLRVSGLNDRLNGAYRSITRLTSFGEDIINTFNARQYDPVVKIDEVIEQVIRESDDQSDKPAVVLSGRSDEQRQRYEWHIYRRIDNKLTKSEWSPVDSGIVPEKEAFAFNFNGPEVYRSPMKPIAESLRSSNIETTNMAGYAGGQLLICAINYGREATSYDASVFRSLATQIMFLASLSNQMRQTENAFNYAVYALARAAEENDEDTGNHIGRVGEYCRILSERLGLDKKLVEVISNQAILHDVGKIHISSLILKKPTAYTEEEYSAMKRHTIIGARIIGDNEALRVGGMIALNHHERWDGSGYPYGIAGEKIPLESRIATVADVYDALRNPRVYKPAFDHQKACKIMTEGDGRTMPGHFDPEVLQAFKETAYLFEATYEGLKG